MKRSEVLLSARRRAREAAAKVQHQEGVLLGAAEKYFLHLAEADAARLDGEEQLRKIAEKNAASVVKHQQKALDQVQTMLDTGTPLAQVATRLETTPAALKKQLKKHQHAPDPGQAPDEQATVGSVLR